MALNALEVSGRRHDDAAGAVDGFRDEGRDGVRPFLQDEFLEVPGDAVDERLLGFAGQRLPIMVRAMRVKDVRDRQIEHAMIVRNSRQARGATVTP